MAKGQRWRRKLEVSVKRRVFVAQNALKCSSACALFGNYTNVWSIMLLEGLRDRSVNARDSNYRQAEDSVRV
jgi:hypothetical protein